MDTRFQEEEGELGRAALKRRSGGALLALRLGLRHASRLCEPLGPGAPEGSRPNLCYSGGVGSDKAYQHV